MSDLQSDPYLSVREYHPSRVHNCGVLTTGLKLAKF